VVISKTFRLFRGYNQLTFLEICMLKKLLLAVVTLLATMSFAFAAVDVNKADQAALDGVKGIGPAKSKAILAERTKAGDFKDWADFEKRVKGIGEKNSVKLSEAGLTVNGQAKAGAPAKAEAPKSAGKASASSSASSSTKATSPAPAAMPASAAAAASTKASATK
jgi:competence protein ComEA